jgi:hypothetical protein
MNLLLPCLMHDFGHLRLHVARGGLMFTKQQQISFIVDATAVIAQQAISIGYVILQGLLYVVDDNTFRWHEC